MVSINGKIRGAVIYSTWVESFQSSLCLLLGNMVYVGDLNVKPSVLLKWVDSGSFHWIPCLGRNSVPGLSSSIAVGMLTFESTEYSASEQMVCKFNIISQLQWRQTITVFCYVFFLFCYIVKMWWKCSKSTCTHTVAIQQGNSKCLLLQILLDSNNKLN